jgi:hypothetical protein
MMSAVAGVLWLSPDVTGSGDWLDVGAPGVSGGGDWSAGTVVHRLSPVIGSRASGAVCAGLFGGFN